LDNSTKVLSTSDDKTLKVWDTKSGCQISSLSFAHTPHSIEVSRDGKLVLLSEGKNVDLYDSEKFTKLNSFTLPCGVTAASIHPNNGTFVCADENFTLYKYSIATGAVLESFKGHFGPIHAVQFSPDGKFFRLHWRFYKRLWNWSLTWGCSFDVHREGSKKKICETNPLVVVMVKRGKNGEI